MCPCFTHPEAVRGARQPKAEGDSLRQSQPQQVHGDGQDSLHR